MINTVPGEVLIYSTNFLDVNSAKNFGAVSKELNHMIRWSPKYLSAYLSSYFTKALPQDEQTAECVRTFAEKILESIAKNSCHFDKPIRLFGSQLPQILDPITQGNYASLRLHLLLHTLNDTTAANASPLLPHVEVVEFSDRAIRSNCDYEIDEKCSQELKQHCTLLVPLLEKMTKVHSLTFSYSRLQITLSQHFPQRIPFPSIKELHIHQSPFMLPDCASATEQLFQLFPGVEKLTLYTTHTFLGDIGNPIVKDIALKELRLVEPHLAGPRFAALLKKLPTIEKVSIHNPESMSRLFFGLGQPHPTTTFNIKEIHITDPHYINDEMKQEYGNAEKLKKNLLLSFPKIEDVTIEDSPL